MIFLWKVHTYTHTSEHSLYEFSWKNLLLWLKTNVFNNLDARSSLKLHPSASRAAVSICSAGLSYHWPSDWSSGDYAMSWFCCWLCTHPLMTAGGLRSGKTLNLGANLKATASWKKWLCCAFKALANMFCHQETTFCLIPLLVLSQRPRLEQMWQKLFRILSYYSLVLQGCIKNDFKSL